MDQGQCVTSVIARTKTLGQACTQADAGSGSCNCLWNPTTNRGACTQFCVVGSSAAACPAGYVCDAQEPTSIGVPATDASVAGFATQNTGVAGRCLRPCGDGGACTASTCDTSSAAGPVCVP